MLLKAAERNFLKVQRKQILIPIDDYCQRTWAVIQLRKVYNCNNVAIKYTIAIMYQPMNSWTLKSMAQVIAYLLFSRNNLICDKLLKNIVYSTKIFSIFPKIMVIRTFIPMFHSFPPQGTCKGQYLSFPKGFLQNLFT